MADEQAYEGHQDDEPQAADASSLWETLLQMSASADGGGSYEAPWPTSPMWATPFGGAPPRMRA